MIRRSLAWLLLLTLVACSRPPDEDQIRGAMAELIAAAEAGEVRGVVEHVADDFVSRDGELDRRTLELYLRAQFMRHRDIGVGVLGTEVELQGDRATVRVRALLTGGSGGLFPEQGRVHVITSGWRRQSGDWQIVTADWQ